MAPRLVALIVSGWMYVGRSVYWGEQLRGNCEDCNAITNGDELKRERAKTQKERRKQIIILAFSLTI